MFTKKANLSGETSYDMADYVPKPYLVLNKNSDTLNIDKNSYKSLDPSRPYVELSGSSDKYYVTFGDSRSEPSMYGSIYKVTKNGDIKLGTDKPAGTYRSLNSSDKATIYIDGKYTLFGDAIFDELKFKGVNLANETWKNTHGSNEKGLYGMGKILIIGTGIEVSSHVQIFGGKDASITTKIPSGLSEGDQKTMIFSDGSSPVTVNLATCLIIHSGVYYNVALGGRYCNIGSANTNLLSTYGVLKGGAVLDTVYGSSVYGDVYSATSGTSSKDVGGTFLYITGAFMPGDDWVDKNTDDYKGQRTSYELRDVSVINGGSRQKSLIGSSHVLVTDHASVYDVTGAGRESSAYTDFSYLEVSGRATVRHAACGGAMNAVGDNKYLQLIGHSYVSILGNCRIANVYGAGYDIWDKTTGRSMINGGTITVSMSGGEVGNIYGGGYRGSVGDINNYSSLKIKIIVDGGTILDSVYGGGSGGLDKAKHDGNGNVYMYNGPGWTDTTGRSFVYGDIDIQIKKGEIGGSVYGGGMSVPLLNKYKDRTFSDAEVYVAQTFGNVKVDVSGGSITGSVYGGGKGVVWQYVDDGDTGNKKFVVEDTTKIVLMGPEGLVYIDWYVTSSSNEITFHTGTSKSIYVDNKTKTFKGNYLEYSRVLGNVQYVKVSDNPLDGNIHTHISGSVYGGGSNGKIIANPTTKIGGNTYVEITGGVINENVFGGGVGIDGIVSVTGERIVSINYLTVDNSSINMIGGSVYGGSSIGDDGDAVDFPQKEEDYQQYIQNHSSTDSTVIIEQAIIGDPETAQDSSVYGGGFMGKTWGNSEVYVGYHYDPLTGSISPYNDKSIRKAISLDSIYAGGNINVSGGQVEKPYEEDLVMGTGKVHVSGNSNSGDVIIKGSVMGSGNSCKTRWSTSIDISELNNTVTMNGIHRASSLVITQSTLDLSSRSTLTPVAGSPSKDLSIFAIDDLTLKYDSLLILRAPVDYIGNFHSLSKDNKPTTLTSPSNEMTFTSGSTFYVREMDVGDRLSYGKVEGYTILNTLNQEVYGAYLIANQYASTGGFVVYKEGTYKEADFSTSIAGSTSLKCWFIAGTQSKVVTMNLPFAGKGKESTIGATLDIMKMQSGTKMRYTGATLTSVSTDSQGNSFEFMRPGDETKGYQFGLLVGYSETTPTGNTLYADSTKQRYLNVVQNGDQYERKWVYGTYYSDDPNESKGSLEPPVGEESSGRYTVTPLAPIDLMSSTSDAGLYKLNLLFTGKPENTTLYVGYMTINLQEVSEIEYEATDEHGNITTYKDTMVTGNVSIRVDLYVIGTGSIRDSSEYRVVLKAQEDNETGQFSGYSEIIIPTGFLMGKLVLTNVETEHVHSGQSISISAFKNQDNTTGWMTINNPVLWTKDGDNDSNPVIGTMSGTVVATIRYSISDYVYPTLDEDHHPLFILHFQTTIKDGTVIPSIVTVEIQKKSMRTVTYHDDFSGLVEDVKYPDGTFISANSWKTMSDNFIGWYTDSDFTNKFDYKTPITKDIDLYARYSYVVTLDFMTGTTSTLYIASDRNGAVLNENIMPTMSRPGYSFIGWCKDPTCIVQWDYAFDYVDKDVTLYAKWEGVKVKVNFLYKNGNDYVEFTGEVNPPDKTAAQLEASIHKVGGEYVDDFGNRYERVGNEYNLIYESLYMTIKSGYEREYEYLVDTQEYKVKVGEEFKDCTDKEMLDDLSNLKGYCFKAGDKYYKKISENQYRCISDSSWAIVSPIIVNEVDQFGNEYVELNDNSYAIKTYHFYKYEVEFKKVSTTYYERVASDEKWIVCASSPESTYHKDQYSFHYGWDGTSEKYKSESEDYVMIWDGGPYYPTVRYGSTFSTEDPEQSSKVSSPVLILEYAEEEVQKRIGNDKFIRWQAFPNNDPKGSNSTAIYSDTELSAGMVNFDDIDWQSDMPEINLYALTAKVAINLSMDKNVEDASAAIASPSSFLAYPSPTQIVFTGEYFNDPCPYHPKNYTEKDGNNRYLKYTDDISGSSDEPNYYYKVVEKNEYLSMDGLVRYTYDSTYGYYSLSDENCLIPYPEYNPEEAGSKYYYKDKYGNVYEYDEDPSATIYENPPDPDKIVEMRIYTYNDVGNKFRITPSEKKTELWNGTTWVLHDPITGYYYKDADGNRYVKESDTQYRMIDWYAEDIPLESGEGSTKEDTLGLDTIWTRIPETSKYEFTSGREIHERGTNNLYSVVFNENPGVKTLTYSLAGNVAYRETYVKAIGQWQYQKNVGTGSENWIPCTKNNNLYLIATLEVGTPEYVLFGNERGDIGFAKIQWKEIDVVINGDHEDQFGNKYSNDNETLVYSIVYKFEDEFVSEFVLEADDETGAAVGDWISYRLMGKNSQGGEIRVITYLEHTENEASPSDVQKRQYITMRKWDSENGTWNGWDKVNKRFEDKSESYREEYTVQLNEDEWRRFYIPSGGDWKNIYSEYYDHDNQKWHYFSYGSGQEVELESPIVQFYFKDISDNHYYSYDWFHYTCFYGSEKYYLFEFNLNEATRNGYKLIGWHNTHVNTDDALYPTAGVSRTLKLFYNETEFHTVITKEVLSAMNISGEQITFVTIDYGMYEAENHNYSYSDYKGKPLPRLDDPTKKYDVTYQAMWEPMIYSVSVVNNSHGEVNAFIVRTDGSRELINGSVSAMYGDRIEVTYSSTGNYFFNRWTSSGECEIEDQFSTSTTIVVHGNCSISANDIGERVVNLPIRFDAGILNETDRRNVTVVLRNTLTNTNYELTNVDHSNGAEVFRGYAPLNSNDPNEEYSVIVRYSSEEYTLKGNFRVEKDNDLNIEYDIISARIMQKINTLAAPYEIWTEVNGIRLPDNSIRTQLQVGDDVVASVTRYVGVMTSYLNGDYEGYIINNPYNGVPAVELTIAPGYDYLTFEGFPDVNVEGVEYFNLNTEYNYHKGHSFEPTIATFDLNWTRTDRPADIIVQLVTNATPTYQINYTTVGLGAGSEKVIVGTALDPTSGSIDESFRTQLSEARTTFQTSGDYYIGDGNIIQGWYYDIDLTKPIYQELVKFDESTISSLELNKVDGKYRIYAKVVDSDKVKKVTVGVKVQNVNGDGYTTTDVVTYVEEAKDDTVAKHGLDIKDGGGSTYSSSDSISGRAVKELSGDHYTSDVEGGQLSLYAYEGLRFHQTLRDGKNSNISMVGHTVNNTSEDSTVWGNINGYGFFDISFSGLEDVSGKHIWIYQKSSALSPMPSGKTWAHAMDGQPYTEAIQSIPYSSVDNYANDLHVLIPQDGSNIILKIYVMDDAAKAEDDYDDRLAALSDKEPIVIYTIDTKSVKTIVDLDLISASPVDEYTRINEQYIDWSYGSETLSGVVTSNVEFLGTEISIDDSFTEEIVKQHGLDLKVGSKYTSSIKESGRYSKDVNGDEFKTTIDAGVISFYAYNGVSFSQFEKDGNEFILRMTGKTINNAPYNSGEWGDLNGFGFFDISFSGLEDVSGKHIWIYQKSSALSPMPSGKTWAHAMDGQPYTEAIQSIPYSSVDNYANDLHVLIPQDGNNITLRIYVMDGAATGSYNDRLTALNLKHPIALYDIETDSVKTQVELNSHSYHIDITPTNSFYKNWTYNATGKVLNGVIKSELTFLGTGITISPAIFSTTFPIYTDAGFHVVDDGLSPTATVTGVGYNLAVNYKDETAVSLSIDLFGPSNDNSTAELKFNRNSVNIRINLMKGDVSSSWSEKDALFENVVTLPTVTRSGVANTGWSMSPIVGLSGNQYTVGPNDPSRVVFTPIFNPTSFYKVTFITNHGTYKDNGQYRITLEINKTNSGLTENDFPVIIGLDDYIFAGYKDFSSGEPITDDCQFIAEFNSINHNLTFVADNADHCEVSATKDSSLDLLKVGGYNDLETHSEISVIIKPTKGRTIAINETRDSAYKRIYVENAIVPTKSQYEAFGSVYDDDDIQTSIVWMYEGTSNLDHTQGYYSQYKITWSTGTFEKNIKSISEPEWESCGALSAYLFIPTSTYSSATGDHGKFLMASNSDYILDLKGEKFHKTQWVKAEIGYPVQLSNNRGFLWTFFLDSDMDVTYHTSVLSVNINFVVNGESIDDGKHYMKVWPEEVHAPDYYYLLGNNVPMYSHVVFFGYKSDPDATTREQNYSTVKWYRDRACTIEYPYTIVDGHIEYSYMATEDITLYANEGVVTTYMYDHNGEATRGYLLDKVDGKITLNSTSYPLDNYLFVGWGELSGNVNVYRYAPASTFAFDGDRLELYAYYLKGGTDQSIPYDGDVHTVSIEKCADTGGSITQDLSQATLVVRFSDTGEIHSTSEGSSYLEYEDYTEKTVYYYGTLSGSAGSTTSIISGSLSFKITKVELYLIAPSATYVYDGLEHVVSSADIKLIATTADGSPPNPNDIAAVILDTTMPGYTDRITDIGSVRTAVSIYFVDGKADNYIIHYVDGSLVVYPNKTGRYMWGGY